MQTISANHLLEIGHFSQIYWLFIFSCKNLIFNSNETCYMFKNADLSQNVRHTYSNSTT
uniref:Uncharacterized protein n=1 Tax=Octopus bimaculoides TaxID=37653 RepID=A0A0L8HQK1_OCTBM